MGIQNIPFGLKITIFDADFKIENGIFLTISNDLWKKDEKEKEGYKKKKYKLVTTLEENYEIANFLRTYGFDFIYNSLILEKKGKTYEIIGKKFMKNMAICDNFENIFTIPAFSKYLQQKN